jgi:HAE1 family hydrophobic/amphiphilic exporter-1
MSISDTSIKKPKTVLIFTLILVALGLYTFKEIAVDLLPDISLPYVVVVTQYPNASPEEVESRVTKTMEGTFAGVTGIKKITSSSSEGNSTITLEFSQSTNLDQATNMIRDRLSLIDDYLPDDATSPMIIQMDSSLMPIMGVSVTGNKTSDELLDIATDIVEPGLEQLDGVASASVRGGREKAIKIEVPLGKLETLGLSLTQMAGIIGAQNWKSDAGIVTDHGMNYTISSEGTFQNIEEIKNTIVSTKTDSQTGTVSQIKLGDIANVYEGYKDSISYAYINGEPGIILALQKQSGTNSLQVVNTIKAKMVSLNKILPDGVKLKEAFNTTDSIGSSISNVTSSAIIGALLAVIVILIFLRSFSSTLTISLTIPISLIVTLLIMRFTNHTINMMSLAGLTLGVGMLVDNSIVILENIFSYREKGAKPHIAAALGANEMRSAITSSTLTTICVFIPLLLFRDSMNGVITIFEDLAFTVIVSLLTSLLVALILVPTLSSSIFKGRVKRVGEKQNGIIAGVETVFVVVEKNYARFIRWCLHHKALFVSVIIALLIASVIQLPRLGFIFIPETDQTSITTTLQFPHGTDLEIIDMRTKEIESVVAQKVKGYKTISTQIDGGTIMAVFFGGGGSSATLDITLKDASERVGDDMTANQAIAAIDSISNNYTGIDITTETSSSGVSLAGTSSDIDITLRCDDFERLTKVSNQIVELLKTQGSELVTNVSNSIKDGNPQLSLVFDKNAMNLNYINSMSVAQELKADLSGTVVGRYTQKGDDIDIVLSLSNIDRFHKFNLDQITVTNAIGQKIPLSAFSHFEETTSAMAINREDQGRVAHITAKNAGNRSINELNASVSQLLYKNVPTDEDLSFTVGGSWDSMKEGIDVFIKIILMAAILVFAVMASQFESFKDPFIVIFTLPLALIGIALILTLMHSVISIMTLVGSLVLVGIIVNNGIVLVDYTNLLRKRGYNLEDACTEAAHTRLRPILMTTLTTVLALVPMTFFPGEGSQLIQPIGQVIFGGLSFGTLMTLTMMPIIYFIFNMKSEKNKIKKVVANKTKNIITLDDAIENNKGEDK